jgi:GNAT superfamily N-acetyltransferase
VLLAESDGRAIGFASYHEHYSTFLGRIGLWLDDLFIEASFRGQGIGKAIFQALCRIAVERKAARIEWCVAADNDSGIAFYEGIGASVNRNQYPVRLDEERLIQMAKKLE